MVDVVNKIPFTSLLFVNDLQSRYLIPFRDSFTGPDPVVCIACAPMTTAHGRCDWVHAGKDLRCVKSSQFGSAHTFEMVDFSIVMLVVHPISTACR